MRILYGVCGEGLGHATRTKVVLAHLARRGHEVFVGAAAQAYTFLERFQRSPGAPPFTLVRLVGLTFACRDGGIDLHGTLETNARALPSMLADNARSWDAARLFEPEAAITDFDSFAWSFGRAHGLPVLSLDNGQVVRCCAIDPAVERAVGPGLQLLATANTMIVPDADHYVVTSFFFPPVRRAYHGRVTMIPALLRPEVLAALDAPPAHADHVLVYKTASLDDGSILGALASSSAQRFVIYGLRDPAQALPPNVVARPFDEAAFIDDLRSARAVVGNGGMSMLGEAVAFRRPVLAVPVRGQYEQEVNAAHLARLGLGASAPTLDAATLERFLVAIPRYQAALERVPPHDRNARLYSALDALLPESR